MTALSPRQRDVQAAYANGRKMGNFEARMDAGWRLPVGVCVGLVIGNLIPLTVFWIKGVCF